MAKKQQQKLNKLLEGMNRDVNPIDQPHGTYRFAYNAVNQRDMGAISNELGTEHVATILGPHTLIGTIDVHDYVSDTKFVLFTVNESTGDSVIGKLDFKDNYSTLLNDSTNLEKFNFSTRFPIEGEYKINATGEISVYWTDDDNVPKFLNLSNIPVIPFSINILDLFPKISKYPQVSLERIRSSAGTLRTGSYQLAIAFMTEDGAVTSYLEVSNPVYINDESEGNAQTLTNSWGGISLQPTNYNGADGATPTSKAIEWVVSSLDTSYEYIVPCIIRTINNAKDAVVLNRERIDVIGNPINVLYTGYEEAVEEVIAAVQIPKESYTKAKTVAQVDDVLYWGNLEKQKIDIGYQKYANNIKIFRSDLNRGFLASASLNLTEFSAPITVNFTKGALTDGFDSSVFKGYKRGEVYAFYITWVLKDGSETVAYHIPGREAIENDLWVDINGNKLLETDNVKATTTDGGLNNHPFSSQIANWGSEMPLYYFHQGMSQYGLNNSGRGMGYWENSTETYPLLANDPDGNFEEWTVNAFGNSLFTGNTLHGKNVRHHHFPLTTKSVSTLNHNTTKPAYAPSSTFQEYAFNPTGIKINDVPVPDFIIKDCVAYKIYYVKKGEENMVCLASTQIQGGRENNQEHVDAYGGAWLCMPWQLLDFPGSTTVSTPFFVAEPLDLMQTGSSIASVDYVSRDPYISQIGAGSGFSIYADDSFGQPFHQTGETHIVFDWARNNQLFQSLTDFYQKGIRVLKAKTRVPAGAIFGSVGGFSLAVDNEQGTETMAFEMYNNWNFHNNYDDIGNTLAWYANAGNAWPTTNQLNQTNGLNYDMRKSYANFMSFKGDVHYGFEKQRDFVYTGYSSTVDETLVFSGTIGVGGYMDRPVQNPVGATTIARGTGPTTMGGDVHIGYYAVDKYRETEKFTDGNNNFHHIYAAGAFLSGTSAISNVSINPSKPSFHDYTIHNFITESRVHAMWRHSNNDEEAFYPAYPVNHPSLLDHENPSKRYPKLNADYLVGNDVRLLRSWDPDDVLQTFTDFPTRIIRSVKYNQSGLTDNFRVYLPEDFRDLPRHRGELWKVKAYNNIVIPHMERALYMTKGKEALKMNDASEAFLGTGDLFAKDPAEILLTDSGHAGTGSQRAAITSEFGYFFADKEAGKVFLLGEKLEEISMYGMRKFFLNNLNTGSAANALQQSIGPSLNFDNSIRNMGLVAGYDPELKRFLLTKKDIRQHTIFPQGTIYDDTKRWWYDSNGAELDFDTYWEAYYEWTLSYDPQVKAWISFHAYHPCLYISTLNAIYSNPNSPVTAFIYKHNSLEPGPGSFYLSKYPFIVDLIDNQSPDLVKAYKSIDYTVDVTSKDNEKMVANTPFDFIGVYNSYQESGLINVIPLTNNRRVDRMWFFNDFRDLAVISNNYPTTNNPMSHNDGNFLGSTVTTLVAPGTQTTRFMPSINSNFINTLKVWSDKRRFVDKWMGIRLIYTQDNLTIDNNLVSLYTVNAHKKINYR